MKQKRFFTRELMDWHHHGNDRDLPWKNEKDPYRIWLSEIILQQTTAQQGWSYYNRFITHYPTVRLLAAAPEEEVFKLWEGLGYYSRCRNLLKAAQIIVKEWAGHFPEAYEDILSLPGVGPYTAAAISSFAFRQPYAVLDGNVYRVLSRYFGILTPIDTTIGRKEFQALAQDLLDKNDPGAYNQAIMDMGATVCTPRNPQCGACPVEKYCYTFHELSGQLLLPVKSKKIQKKERYFHYFLLESADGAIYFEQRVEKDIWQDLYQPLLLEWSEPLDDWSSIKELLGSSFPDVVNKTLSAEYAGVTRQVLTHRKIITHWFHIRLREKVDTAGLRGRFLDKKNYKKLAFPQTIFSFMSKNSYF